jgi:16S rRNA pseudouridine516 synthase
MRTGPRLDAFLVRAGYGSRSDVRRLIRQGRVALDGVPCRNTATHLEGRTVTVDDEPTPEPILHAIMHKPLGVACSRDPRESPLVFDLLPSGWMVRDLNPVGRLDRDTSGLLLFTCEGALLQRLTHPRRKVSKRYRVTFAGELPKDAVLRVASGIALENDPRPTLPATLIPGAASYATLITTEGRYHLVRRIFAASGVVDEALHRDRIGGLELPSDLHPGEVRALTEKELAAVQRSHAEAPLG